MSFRLREGGAKSALHAVLLIIFVPLLAITTFAFSGDDGEEFLLILSKETRMNTFLHNDEERRKEKDDVNARDADNGGDDNGIDSATTGAGLNLNLINNITTENYVKGLLSTFAKNQNGEYSSDYQLHAPLVALLAAASMEHGYYRGTHIPVSYFGWNDAENAPYYNVAVGGLSAQQMTFEGFATAEYNALKGTQYFYAARTDGGRAVGMFGATSATSSKRASVSTVTNGGREEGDMRYLPDACVSQDRILNSAMDVLKIQDRSKVAVASQEAVAGYGGLSNNRGYNGSATMFYGLAYHMDLRGNPGSKVNFELDTDEDKIKLIEKPYLDMQNAYKSLQDSAAASITFYEKAGGGSAWYTGTMLLLESGWFCTSDYVDGACNNFFNPWAKNAWNDLHPDKQVSSGTELRAYLEQYVRTSVSGAIKEVTGRTVSAQDVARVYGIVGDDYNNNSYREGNGNELSAGYTGYVFTVMNETSPAYINKYSDGTDPYRLMDLENTGCGYYFNCSMAGSSIYAYMLRYAGVGVDPTNPATYYTEAVEPTEWVPEVNSSLSFLEDFGVDLSGISAERAKILTEGYALCGIEYHQCRGNVCQKCGLRCDGYCYNSDTQPTHLDCSSFIWRSYWKAGFDMTGFPTSTGTYSSSMLTELGGITDLQPGDILWRSGHVMMYVGMVGNDYLVMEASMPGVLSSAHIRSQSSARVSKFYRYPGLQ